ncbi:hypothetical protein T552_02987 [Pneumocystis carinii B80]|uniref:DUF2423 domain-containing protein n=1 Tax=Pneumocystis carinii (strain B80) TaxID=1408658 RepID=A0A0W4ZCL8_PNEC8|nr:hypothetical protein T552_02987 [Pneumocystis carinii B80]KTW26092.1 hypothetical protein T552_02987 [Pneumocystis carinii B80]
MAKSVRSHRKKVYRSLRRRVIFEPIYADRVKRLSSRLKNLFCENIKDMDEMMIDEDKNNNMNEDLKEDIDIDIDDTQKSSEIQEDEGYLKEKHERIRLKKKKPRKIKNHRKKRTFGTCFSDLRRKKR